jgi:hypothetical protein
VRVPRTSEALWVGRVIAGLVSPPTTCVFGTRSGMHD